MRLQVVVSPPSDSDFIMPVRWYDWVSKRLSHYFNARIIW